MTRKWNRLWPMIFIGLLALAACTPGSGGASDGADASDGDGGDGTGALSGELTLWHAYGSGGTAEGEAFNQILENIESENPDLAVTVLEVPFDQLFTNFQTEAAAGGGPDLFIAPNDSLGSQARAGLLAPLDDHLSEEFLSEQLEVAVEGSKVDGVLYAVPESLKAVAMFYNTQIVPEPPETMDDLMALLAADVRIGINQNAYHNWGFWYAFGGQIMDDSGACVADETGVAEAVAFLQDLKGAGAQFYTDGAAFQDDFELGELDLIIEGPWFTGDAKAALGDDLGVAPMPEGPGGPAQPMTGVDGWYINANSSNIDLAVAFALETVKPENEQIYVDVAGHIPANANIEVSDPVTATFAQAVETGFARPQSAQMDQYWGPWGNELNLALDTGKDAAQAVADACAAMDEANNIDG